MATFGKKAIIIGAGPAGLTAAYELLVRTDIKPVIYETGGSVGGIARTEEYKGNKIDIGGHRLFSKSDRVVRWWTNFLPLQGAPSIDQIILKKKCTLSKEMGAPDPEKTDRVMLLRDRVSRIFYLRKFFEYPLSLHFGTFAKLGPVRILKIGVSYIRARLFPLKEEKNLEDFFINRFGKELYLTFFKDYTEKVWGTACSNISAEWGRQRIKGLSIIKVLLAAVKHAICFKNSHLSDKNQETSLIDQFMYPKLGVGQLWEEVASAVKKMGGTIHLHHQVIGLLADGEKISQIRIKDKITGETKIEQGDYFFSTMPVKDLVRCMGDIVPREIMQISEKLVYRDFITVGLLLKNMKIQNDTGVKTINNTIPDNWIYVQEKDVRLGRIQIYNNWSPYMVKDIQKPWLGLEYFCNEGDDLWRCSDTEIVTYAIDDLVKIGFIENGSVLQGAAIRTLKAYPCYFGSYKNFNVIRDFTDKFTNLYLIGRNGMHRYNNMDHSMLTAMTAVDNIVGNIKSKNNIWSINTDEVPNE